MRQLVYAILAIACATSAFACDDHAESAQSAPRGYYKDGNRYCYEAIFKGKIYRSCY